MQIHNVQIKGISGCVPQRVEHNRDYPYLSKEEIEKYISTIGVENVIVQFMMAQYARLIYVLQLPRL